MDVVYLVKNDPENDSNELRYSLRSLKNIPHDNVFIVGEKPEWVKNVTYIPVHQTAYKARNVTMNLRAAVMCDAISDEFILMNDDFFIMKQMPSIPPLYFGRMQDVIAQYEKRYPEGTEYIATMKKLNEVLIAKGFEDPLNYELHVPMVLKRSNMQILYDKEPGTYYQLRSYYGNYFSIGGDMAPDVKIFIDPRHNSPEYQKDPLGYMQKQQFLSSTGGAYKRGLAGDFIRAAFPEKSPYEC